MNITSDFDEPEKKPLYPPIIKGEVSGVPEDPADENICESCQ